MAVSTRVQGGRKPSRFMAESNLPQPEEQKAPYRWVFLCTHGCFLGLSTSPAAPGSPGGGNTAGRARQPAASSVSVAGAGAAPTAALAQWPPR